MPYCPRCGTALSSHEVALGYHDVVDPSIYVRFPVAQPAGPLHDGDALLVWTTTPWTLVSNAAVAIDPDLTYVRARQDGEVYVLAEARVEPVLGEGAEVLERFPGREIEGTAYEPPFPFIAADRVRRARPHRAGRRLRVSADDGTGLVHTAIAFGEDDFRLGEQYGLNVINPVRADGTYDERIGPYAGRFVKDADPDLIADLESRGLIYRAEQYEHAYPHCWRCDTPLLYYAKREWYIRTTARRDELLAANESIEWYPFHIKHGRFGKWLENNVDWALSRERYWGTPLPVWRCEDGHDHCIGSIAELRELAGRRPRRPAPALHRRGRVRLPRVRRGDAARAGGDRRLVRLGRDAVRAVPLPVRERGAVQGALPGRLHLRGARPDARLVLLAAGGVDAAVRHASYRNVLCLGLILDPDGQKMSKSRGNVVAPWDVIDRHGADAFRWYYFTSQQPWSGYRFSVETVGESVRKFLLTLWNTYSFYVLYANVDGVRPRARTPSSPRDRPALDRWVLSRLQGTIAAVRAEARRLRHDLGRALDRDLRRRSLELVRAPQRAAFLAERRGGRGRTRIAAYLTLHDAPRDGVASCSRRSPRSSRTRSTATSTAREPSVHLCDFPEPDEALIDRELEFDMAVARRTVELGRAARSQAKVKVRQPLREAVVVADPRERAAIERLEDQVLDELNVKGDLLRGGGGGARSIRGEAELPRARAALRLAHAGGREGDRAARPGRDRGGASTAAKRCTIEVDGKEERLGADDLSLVMLPREGYQLERQANYAVALQARPRRRAAARGRRARGRARDPERAQGRGPAGRGPHRPHAVAATTR